MSNPSAPSGGGGSDKIAPLSVRHVFGLASSVRDNIHTVDESHVLYPAGNSVVIYNTELKTQKLIPGSDRGGGITALAVSPNRKFVAVAERGEPDDHGV
jgi:hypothetical protein